DLKGKRKMILQLVQLITTVHYLHYLQYQAGSFLEAVLRQKMAGSSQVQALTRSELAQVAARVNRGKTSLLLMLNARQVYGHVVLAYRVAKLTDGSTLIEVYDSNVQYGTEKRASVLKVDPEGKVGGYYRLEPNGTLKPDAIYDSDGWFSDRENLAVIDLPNVSLSRENRDALAKKTLVADAETAYLLAGGQFIKSVTEQSPQESSLRADTLQFLRNIQAIQTSLGHPPAEQLPEDADVTAINRFLERHADAGIRTAFPYALPKGISLTDTKVKLDEKDPNRVEFQTTLTLDKDGPQDKLVSVLQRSATLSEYRELADWVAATRKNVGPTKIRAQLDTVLEKKKMPDGMALQYGVMPTLRGTHLVLGDIEPSKRLGTHYQIEVSKPTLKGGLATAMDRVGIVGHDYTFDYTLVPARYTPSEMGHQLQLTPQIDRSGRVTLEGMDLDLIGPPAPGGGGRIRLIGRGSAFVAVNPVMADRGVSGAARPLNLDLMIYRGNHMPDSQWCVYVDALGTLKFQDGVFNLLAGAVTKLADKLFPFIQGRVNGYIRDELTQRVKLVKPFQIQGAHVSTTRVSFRATGAVVDLEDLAQQLFQVKTPVVLRRIDVFSDRIVLGADHK
ncbi:MAG: hypothetical protein HY814_12400, partial [Candidatus Riflebacteria bacterium]|nr:hypothetical protein [Candidatus Riflebacteria bacterium]